jgi:hypothetical protein
MEPEISLPSSQKPSSVPYFQPEYLKSLSNTEAQVTCI